MQTRYLTKVDGRKIPGIASSVQREITAACRLIRRRTGWQGWYHALLGTIQFHPGEQPKNGSVSDTVFQRGRYLRVRVDEVCDRINATKMPMHKKERIVERSHQQHDDKRDTALGKITEELMPTLKDMLGYQRRMLHSPHSQRVFVMNSNP